MTFTFKLSQRLARMRRFATVSACFAVLSCTDSADLIDPSSQDHKSLIISPRSTTLTPYHSVQFEATSSVSRRSLFFSTLWTATGGSVDSLGRYTAGDIPGRYHVVVTTRHLRGESNWALVSDTAAITIASIAQIVLSPVSVNIPAGSSVQFTADGRSAENISLPIVPSYAATGGIISADGIYTAGSTAGDFLVIVTDSATGKADTSAITITMAEPEPPSPPHPGPTVEALEVIPTSVLLSQGTNQQFTVIGKMSDGSTSDVSVIWSASGGAISSAGLYTAGETGGTYNVIATHSDGALADTATVTLVVSPPTPPGSPPPTSAGCPTTGYARLVNVASQVELTAAISAALPGDQIRLAPGRYVGSINIPAGKNGTQSSPITLCGPRSAIIDNGPIWRSLISGNWWILKGFKITGGIVGLVAENANNNVFDGLLIEHVAQEALALHGPLGSSNNTVIHNTIRYTGENTQFFAGKQIYGEGIYIGDGISGSHPSNNNRVLYNTLGPYISAEHVDVKAGSTGNLVQGNVSDATGTVPVNLHVNGVYTDNGSGNTQWLDNRVNNMNHALLRGFYIFRATGARLSGNSVTGPAMRYGYEVVASTAIVVSCDNIGTSNIACTP